MPEWLGQAVKPLVPPLAVALPGVDFMFHEWYDRFGAKIYDKMLIFALCFLRIHLFNLILSFVYCF